jgi:CubicO group peptidase (beta-lactamase class C family)
VVHGVNQLNIDIGVSTGRPLRPSPTWIQTTFVLFGVALLFAPSARSQDQASRIDRYLRTKIATAPSSVQVLVAHGDDVLIKRAYAHSGSSSGSTKGDVENRFPVGAVDEQFVAAAILRLQEQGKIRIDAPICSYLSNCPAGWTELHIVHLLTHTSGLPSATQNSPGQKMSSVPHTLRDLVAAADGESPQFKPGAMFKYSSLDFPVLYLVIGSVTGRSPTEYIENEVFRPLGMTATKFSPHEVSTNLSQPYSQDRETRTPWDARLCQHEVCSTLADLYRWERALTKGVAVSHDSVLQMFTPYRDGYGLGWKIIKEFDKRSALKSGRSEAWSLSVRLYPDDDTYIVLVANGDHVDSADLTHEIAAILFARRNQGTSTTTSSRLPAIKVEPGR